MQRLLNKRYRHEFLRKYLYKSQRNFFYINLAIASFFVLLMGIIYCLQGRILQGILNLTTLIPFTGLFLYQLKTKRLDGVVGILLVLFLLSFIPSYLQGGIHDSGLIYPILYPIVVCFLLPFYKQIPFMTVYILLVFSMPILQDLNLIETAFHSGEMYVMAFNEFLVVIFALFLSHRQDRLVINLNYQAYFDSLTGFPNRKRLLKDVDDYSSKALLLINIDNFKEMNDIMGYRKGDSIITHLADLLQKSLPDHSIYRLTGSEFAVLIDLEPIKTEGVIVITKEIQNLLYEIGQNPFVQQDLNITTNVSIGITCDDESQQDNLLSHADLALQQAKRSPSKFFFYKESMGMKSSYQEELSWLQKIEEAFRDNRIIPYYQPIFKNSDSLVDKYECLVRLVDKDGCIFGPSDFLPIVKKNKLGPKLTRTVFRHAVKTVIEKSITVSVNISEEDIKDPFTKDYIILMLDQHNGIGEKIQFELLESETLNDKMAVNQFLELIQRRGCKIAIDDFGAGYSNFDYLADLSVNLVKIDGSLIKDIHNSPEKKKLVKSIVAIAKDLGIDTVAEFVWDPHVLEAVKQLGVDYSQGFLLGEPMPVNDLIKRIEVAEPGLAE